MRGANRVLEYVCMECFLKFSPLNKEEAIQHTNFSHRFNAHLKEVKDG